MSGPFFNPLLLKVPLYITGKSGEEVKEELGLKAVTKLASNESPIGPSPMALEAAQSMLHNAHRYPGVSGRDLRRKLALLLDPTLTEHNLVVGNGGTDVLRMITQAFVFNGGNTVMSRATFPMYHILTTTFGGEPRKVENTSDYRQDLGAMADHIDEDTRLVYLCSPNNPTGQIITQTEADDFVARVPEHVVVIFDESYHDFVSDPAYAQSLVYVKERRNVLIVRSFSKSSGLANLRVGYLIGPVELADYVRHAQLPFGTGAIVLAAAAASLDDETYLARNRQAVIEGREYLYSSFRKMNLDCFPSQANFVTVMDPPMDVIALVDALQHLGFIVRPMADFGMPNGFRVSVGSPEENEGFIEALNKTLEEAR